MSRLSPSAFTSSPPVLRTTSRRFRGHALEHHQEVQDPVLRGAHGEVRGVGEDDRALAEQGGEALAVHGGARLAAFPARAGAGRRAAACVRAPFCRKIVIAGTRTFTTWSAGLPPHSTRLL